VRGAVRRGRLERNGPRRAQAERSPVSLHAKRLEMLQMMFG
jgi:hypothetical protein